MIGLETREHNGLRIARLHYTADPQKRTLEWKAQAQEGLSARQWQREMEVDWSIAAGLGVYSEEFVRDWHVPSEPILANPDLPILRGWDWGLTPACVWCQVDHAGRVAVLAEVVVWNGRGDAKQRSVERFAPEIVLRSNEWFAGATFRDYADPAGWSKQSSDAKTDVQTVNVMGIYPEKGPVTFAERRRAMNDRLTQSILGKPALTISPDCTMLIEGFQGKYGYDQIGETGRYHPTVQKNAWSHPMNALEYVLGALFVPRGTGEEMQEKPRKVGKPDRVTGY